VADLSGNFFHELAELRTMAREKMREINGATNGIDPSCGKEITDESSARGPAED